MKIWLSWVDPVGFPKVRPVEVGQTPYLRPMKKSRFSEAKIISVLKRNERGEKVRDLCRELGISDATGDTTSPCTTGRPSMAASPSATSNA